MIVKCQICDSDFVAIPETISCECNFCHTKWIIFEDGIEGMAATVNSETYYVYLYSFGADGDAIHIVPHKSEKDSFFVKIKKPTYKFVLEKLPSILILS